MDDEREFGIPKINIDDYEIGERLFVGFYSKLYDATEKISRNKVGINTFQLDINKDYQSFNRFCKISNLGIKGIIPIIGYRLPLTLAEKRRSYEFRFDILVGDYVAVMDFSSLNCIYNMNCEYLQSNGAKNENYNPTIRSKIIFGVAAIMKELHEKNIIHYDLNIENVFIDEKHEPKLKISELSKYESDSNDNFFTLGTEYGNRIYSIPPEAFNRSEIDGKSLDVYSYGTLLYQLFTTKTAFEGPGQPRTEAMIQMKITGGKRLKRQDNIPDHYWDLIKRCWDEEPDNRPSFAQIVEELKNDKFALKEYEMQTDIDELHEYQNSIDTDQISSEKKIIEEEEEKQLKNKEEEKNYILEFRSKLKSIDKLFFYPRFIKGDGIFKEKDLNDIKNLEDSEFDHVYEYKGKKICKKEIFINDDDENRAKLIGNVIREFETISSVHFPTICQAIGMESYELARKGYNAKAITKVLYFEYLDYKLTKLIESNLLSDTLKVRIVVDICHGMKYIHDHKMIHRDLNTSNIMLNGAFEAKIVNFGFATVLVKMSNDYSNQQLTQNVGLNAFKSPEIVKGSNYDYKTDVYSFGILLFHIIEGTIQYRNIQQIENNNFDFLDNLDPCNSTDFCKELIEQCIMYNPDERPSFDEILDQLRDNNYMLIKNIDRSIIKKRDIQLMLFNQKHNSDFRPSKVKGK